MQIARVLQLLTDVETSERGYAVGVDEKFLEPYNAALALLPTELAMLKAMIADNPVQRLNAERLEAAAQARIEHAQQVIHYVQTGNIQSARTLIAGGEGKRLMDEVRSIAEQMQAEELRLLEVRRSRGLTHSMAPKWPCGPAEGSRSCGFL